MWSHRYVYRDPSMESKIANLIQGVHVILHGCDGTGVFSLVHTALNDTGIMPASTEWLYEEISENKNLRVMTRSNNRCLEIVMKDYGSNERYLLRNWIQQVSESFTISNDVQLGVRLIVIHNVEWFSKESQNIIAIFAEKHAHCTRYLFTTHQLSLVNRSLQSQCTPLRVPRPDPHALTAHIDRILSQENKTCSRPTADIVADKDAHLENAVDAVQMDVFGAKSTFDQAIHEFYQIIKSKKANKIKAIRDIIYTLLVNNISGNLIFKAVTEMLCVREKKLEIKLRVIRAAVDFEQRLSACERPVYHLEAFFVHLLTFIS
jgi:DNA polymerase III delta prime subunit